MAKPTAHHPPRPHRTLLYAAALAGIAILLLLGYAIGRWTAEEPAQVVAPAPQPPAPAPYAEAPALPPPRPAAQAPAPATPPPAPPAAPQPAAGPTPEIVARVTQDAKAQIEILRPKIVSRCWPAGGLKGGRTSARLTFGLAFDAQGHEIMRGISEERRAPGGEFARCLREMEGTLSIPAPGTAVTVSIPVTFP